MIVITYGLIDIALYRNESRVHCLIGLIIHWLVIVNAVVVHIGLQGGFDVPSWLPKSRSLLFCVVFLFCIKPAQDLKILLMDRFSMKIPDADSLEDIFAEKNSKKEKKSFDSKSYAFLLDCLIRCLITVAFATGIGELAAIPITVISLMENKEGKVNAAIMGIVINVAIAVVINCLIMLVT